MGGHKRLAAVLGMVLVGALASTGASATGSTSADRATSEVATWNLHNNWGANSLSKIDVWADAIASAEPDVLGVQEVCEHQLARLAQKLNDEYGLTYYYIAGPVHNAWGPWNRCTANPIAEDNYGQGVLSKTPISRLDKVYYDDHGDEGRGYLVGKTTVGGESTIVVNTHTDYDSEFLPSQLKQLFERVDGYKRAIVMGDLNTTPDDETLQKYRRQAGFSHAQPDCAEHPNDAGKCWPTHENGRLDYLLLKGVSLYSLQRRAQNPDVSDHSMLIAELS